MSLKGNSQLSGCLACNNPMDMGVSHVGCKNDLNRKNKAKRKCEDCQIRKKLKDEAELYRGTDKCPRHMKEEGQHQ